MEKILNYINGELIEPVSGKFINNWEPATGKVYGTIPDSDIHDVDLAVMAAEKAFPSWSSTTAITRSNYLMKIAKGISHHLEMLAQAETKDNGKPIQLSRTVDIPRAEQNFEFFAHAITQFSADTHLMEEGFVNYTLRQAIGVVACISPWNLPLYLFSWKIAPALAAGNCVVAKPSEVTPMTAFLLSKICMEVGLPPGVLNIVHGTGQNVGQSLVEHKKIKAISFTGGTKTGAAIAAAAAPVFKKLSLELGGKNPVIVFADCDFDDMLKVVIRSSFANQGQICLCGSRILIEESIYEKFKAAFVEKVRQIIPANPYDEKSKMGAIVSKTHFEKILAHIEVAKEEGGSILCGGKAVKLPAELENGWFIEPTVIEGLNNSCKTNQEEIFGPVVTLQSFTTEEEALSIANDSNYGLSATIWTNHLARAHRVAAKVEAGIVWINCWLVRDLRTPFGGVKQSGVGREGGFEALRFFTEAKNVCIKTNQD
jgi:aminomuconate-semialdehyde/2-hydroxymuconate-6-semialdehyde dehydrogenase